MKPLTTRERLCRAFVGDLRADFAKNGAKVIEALQKHPEHRALVQRARRVMKSEAARKARQSEPAAGTTSQRGAP